MQQLLMIKDTCKYLGISRRQLTHLVKTNQIKSINLGLGKNIPRLAFSKNVLDQFLNKNN